MWLIPASRTISMMASARDWLIPPRAAAPKMTRVLRCPVRPNGRRSIMGAPYPGNRACPIRRNPLPDSLDVRCPPPQPPPPARHTGGLVLHRRDEHRRRGGLRGAGRGARLLDAVA